MDYNVEKIKKLVACWIAGIPPVIAEENDAILPIYDKADKSLEVKTRIRWNSEQRYYEMDAVLETKSGTYEDVELQLPQEDFDLLAGQLARIGITRFKNLTVHTAPRRDVSEALGGIFNPTPTQKVER